MTGMPEARILLSEAVIAIATSPKSNGPTARSTRRFRTLKKAIQGHSHIRNAPPEGMKDLGYGEGYLYDHDFPKAIAPQTFLPEKMQDAVYYEPTDHGYESESPNGWRR